MQLSKPQVQRVHVTIRDPAKKTSKCVTIYGGSIEETLKRLKAVVPAVANGSSVPAEATN